jgi:hypothetical protein
LSCASAGVGADPHRIKKAAKIPARRCMGRSGHGCRRYLRAQIER